MSRALDDNYNDHGDQDNFTYTPSQHDAKYSNDYISHSDSKEVETKQRHYRV